jgi:hypothetical protein
MHYRHAIAAAAILAMTTGCSTRPRNFAPQMTTPIADAARFESDYSTCSTLVAQGRTGDFKGAIVTAAATGVGTFGATGAAATMGAIGITGISTAASFAIPGVGLLAGFGVSRAIRSGKERKFKRRMADCLGEYGYVVTDWSRIDRRADAASVVLAAAPASADGEVLADKDGTAQLDRAAEVVR